MKKFFLLPAAFLFVHCSNSGGAWDNPPKIPQKALLEGSASGSLNGLDIECEFEFHLTVNLETPDSALATWGGNAARSVVDGDGAGIGFDGIAAGELRVEFPTDESITLTDTYFDPVEPAQFWEEFFLFTGTRLDDKLWSGTWNCYPFHTRGDSVGVIQGTWFLGEDPDPLD